MHRCLKSPISLLLVLILGLSSSACTYKRAKEEVLQHKRIKKSLWYPREPVGFEFLCTEAGATYAADFILRTDANYKYTAIKLVASIEIRGVELRRDTIAYQLSEPRRRKGAGIALNSYRLRLYESVRLPESGIYKLSVVPLPDEVPLPGVETIGLHTSRIQ